MRILTVAAFLALQLACIRPSDTYDVQLYGQGTELDMVLPAPAPMGGRVEIARMRLWGSNLGLGLTGLFGDSPRSDGLSFVMGGAELAYPRDAGFDRNSIFVNPGAPLLGDDDLCFARGFYGAGFLNFSEYVDVGDHIALTAGDGTRIRLPRDPATYPDPAGESWYVGYGGELMPVVQDHPELADTWRSREAWAVTFPGTVAPAESSVGAIPYPLDGATIVSPAAVEGLRIGGELVRAPHHGYDDAGRWVSDDHEDPVRFAGPFEDDMTVSWTPSVAGGPLTISLRYLGALEEGVCDTDAECETGFSCDVGQCMPDDGSTGAPLGELLCTVHDDGEFTLAPEHLATLDQWVLPEDRVGAILVVARIEETSFDVPDVLTWGGRRIAIRPIRGRAVDAIVTRLDLP